ncbi:TIGR02466 family protein [Sphingomonas sp. ID0503]|uniref:TIGR02466 family protein n=1 Tax=Sphingomonas sp. ID0503 TaxID=3399691 RepID=UPI003AFB31DE
MRQFAALFPTPVYTMPVPDAATLGRALQTAILARRHDRQSVALSNLGGWQSDKGMMDWGGEAARTLLDHAGALCRRVISGLDRTDGRLAWQPEMWANINEPGHSNQTHWHPGSFLSLVYYVDDGYGGSQDRALGGELVFVDPRMPYLRMRMPELRHAQADGSVEEQETWVRPYSGLLIAFPSFLGHSVRPYAGSGQRVSIAINMVVTERAP